MIIYEKNLFQERAQLKDKVSYRCSLYHTWKGSTSCPATLTTDKERKTSTTLSFKGSHNHPDRSPGTLERKRMCHRIKHTYEQNTTRHVRVLAEELGVVATDFLRMKHARLRRMLIAG